ncbi:MAG: hypothetical protein M3349_09305, partial [Actinomycetota bacterium]|nr:hypothetical protein [Actinomycetota bacterium]
MDSNQVEEILSRCQRLLDVGDRPDLGAEGFWKAVGWVKRHPDEVDRFAEPIAAIDRTSFTRAVGAHVSIGLGEALLWTGTVASLVLIGAGYFLASPWDWLVFGAGAGLLLLATHPLAHLVVGQVVGIGFTHVYSGFGGLPQPGAKIDYASYLRTPARQRAWMHASGAIVTKVIPFLLVPAAWAADLPAWMPWL